jgi:hypothetical protein
LLRSLVGSSRVLRLIKTIVQQAEMDGFLRLYKQNIEIVNANRAALHLILNL